MFLSLEISGFAWPLWGCRGLLGVSRYESLVLDRVVDAAASAARAEGLEKHRFQVAQLPLNAFENGAVLGRTPGEKRDETRTKRRILGKNAIRIGRNGYLLEKSR